MDFFGKDKLSRLDEERQRKRQQRAEEALRRLEEVGKQTQQLVANHTTTTQTSAPSEATDASGRRPGGLSRVLFEQATNGADRKNGKKKLDPRNLLNESQKALAQIDGAMSTIKSSVVDATGAGLRGGLEEASKSVTDIVDRVASLASGTVGTLSPSANKNPLAELMAEEQADEHKQNQEADADQTEDHKSKTHLEHKLDTIKTIAEKATGIDLGEKRGGDDDEGSFQFQAQLQGVLPHEAMHAAMSGGSVNLREIAANAASNVIAAGDTGNGVASTLGGVAGDLIRGEDAKTIAANAAGNFAGEKLSNLIGGKAGDVIGSAAGTVLGNTLAGEKSNLGDIVTGAVNAINPLGGVVDLASNAIESSAANIFNPLNVANVAMNAATMSPGNLINNVAHNVTNAAQQLDPANVVGTLGDKLGQFDANAMISNIGNALDPSNLAKVAGTMSPSNLVGIAGQAIENVTARLKDAADLLNPNANESHEITSPRDAASGLPTGKRSHKPMTATMSPENPAGDPNAMLAQGGTQAAAAGAATAGAGAAQHAVAQATGAKGEAKAIDAKSDKLDAKAGPAHQTSDHAHGKATADAKHGPAGAAPQTTDHAHGKTATDAKHGPAGAGAAPAKAADTGAKAEATAAKGATIAATAGATTSAAVAGAGEVAAKSASVAAATSNQATGQAPPPTGPQPGTQTAPQSNKPAAERAAAAQPTKTANATGRNAAPVSAGSGGAMQINPQPVMSPPAREVAQNEKQITQPNVTIEAKGESAALPGMPADLASQTPPPAANTTPAPQATTPSSTTVASNRTVAPLATVTPQPTTAAKPTPPTNVTMPQATAQPMAAGGASAATGATPQPKSSSGASQAGAQSVPANAKAAPPPPATKIPQQQVTPGTAAPQTPATQAPEPNIPPVRAPGGDGAPSPSGMVPQTANLSADRSNASQQLTAEAQTQSKVTPESNTLKQSQVASQKPSFEQTKRSGDAPRQQALTASTAQGQQAGQAGQQRGQQAAQSGNQQIQGQTQGAAAERAQVAGVASANSASVIQQTAPSTMAGAAAPAQAAVTAAAAAARAQQAVVNPAAVARAGQAGATPSQLPPFDANRFNEIDQHPPMPETDLAAAEQSKQAAEQTYQQANTQIDQLANIQPPAINAPQSAGAGTTTKDGQPTREAAIANVEQQVTQQAQAQGPAKMQEAARPLQQEVKQHATSAQQAATTSADSQLQQHQAKSQQVHQQPPPTTAAQAAAQAQPQYQAHQAEATAASQTMKSEIASAQTAANTAAQQAKAQRDQEVTQAQSQYQSQSTAAQGQYAQAQQSAKGQFDSQNQAAQQAMAAEQQAAHQAAQQQTAQAQAKADADIAQQQAQLNSQQQQANASHQQQIEAANQQHDAQVQAANAQMDADISSHQSQMQSQVAGEQSRGQQEVNQHLSEGEQGYQREIQAGEHQAQQEKARAESEAREKERQAQAEKDKNSGGVFGKVVGWVKDRFNDMMNAAKAVLAAARDMIVSIMEKARQAAVAVLNRARQAALAALAKVKSAIQGIISACASAIRSIISACASLVRNLIQNLANMLKSLVQALTTLLQTLVQAFQAAVNALLDGLIAAVSLINKDLGDKLRNATQKYRDAFNNAMNNLSANIKAAGDALQAKIQQAADGAIAVVNAAEQNLNAAVTRVEQTLNAAVETAYQAGAAAINKAFDAAEAVVNKAFDVAKAAVEAYFNAQIAALDLVQQGVNAVADFVIAVADKVLEAVAKIAEAIVNMIPEAWTKWFVDFWNGPWRQAIIIGLATVAAVAITVATCGAAGPVAMVLIAGLIGGTIAGSAYAGGELLAREGAIHLTEEHPGEGVYVPGVGNVQIQIGPDGKPIPPANLTPEQQAAWEKNSQWAMSNFNAQRDAEGNVTGYERRSGSEIANAAVQEGMKGFGEGFVSAAGAMGGSLAGGAVAGLGFVGRVASNPVARQMIASAVEGGVGVVSQSVGAAWTAGFDAMAEGKSPGEAFGAAWKAGSDSITDPGNWVSALASVGVVPLKTKALGPLLDRATGRIANQAVGTAIKEGTDVVVDTMAETLGNAGGSFVSTYYAAINAGKTPAQAMEEARAAANDAFKPEAIIQSLAMNTAGNIANKQAERFAARRAAGATDATPDGLSHPPAGGDSTPAADRPTTHMQADGQPTPDGNARTTRGGDETHATVHADDATQVQRPPTGQQADTPTRHSGEAQTKPVDTTKTSETPQRRVDETQQRRDQTPPRKTDAQTADTQPLRQQDGSPVRADETKPHQVEDAAPPAKTNDPTTRVQEATDVAAEARTKQQQLDTPPPLRDQVDQVTGVTKGDKYEQDMQSLRDFYRQQELEAQQVVKVETDRVDQMIDPATGKPRVNPDGTPYGYGVDSDYDVRRFTYDGQNLTQVTVKVYLAPGQGVDAAGLARVQADTHAGVDRYYNQKHNLPNGDRLNVNVEFVTNPADAHVTVNVGAGKGRADQKNWFVDSDPTVHAHELGHQLGLLDEYHDPDTVRRNDPNSPHVTDDGSLMGNFYRRDAAGNVVIDPNTSLKDRHLGEIGRDIEDSRREGRVTRPDQTQQNPNAPQDGEPAQPIRRPAADDVANAAKKAAIEILGPGADTPDHAIRERLPMDTPVFRVQDAKLQLEPHASPFFDPSAYNLPHGEYEALYICSDRAQLEALRTKQGYFANGDVMHETTIGDLLASAGPGATIVQDAKFNASVLGREEGGYIIVRKKDGSAVETKPREMTPGEIESRDERIASARRLKDEATQRQRLTQQRDDADTLRSDARSLTKELRAAGHTELSDQMAELVAPARLGGKEARLLTQQQLDAVAQQLAASGAVQQLHELARHVPPELAAKVRELAGRLDSTYKPIAPDGPSNAPEQLQHAPLPPPPAPAPAAPDPHATPDPEGTKPPDATRTKPAATDTLEAVLAKSGKSLDDYKNVSPWELQSLAGELLAAKGITNPSESQKTETVYQLDKAIKKGNTEFEAPFQAGVIKLEDGVNERLGNIFGEKKIFNPADLTADRLRMSDTERANLEGGFESGVAGQVRAASFINTRHRAEGDFSHAYGADAWKNFLRAETYLNSIPKGEFINGLSIEHMTEVNRLIHTPDTGAKALALRTVAMVGRGFRWDKGGEVREGKQYARPEHYSKAEIDNLHEAGVRTKLMPWGRDGEGGGSAQLQYPNPEEVIPRMNKLISDLRAELAKPNADPIGAAAQFQRHFVALHPFGDSNGRTSRALMNRILLEFDMPPAIFADQNRDMSMSPQEWRDEVAKGVARSKDYLGRSGVNSKDEYAGKMGVSAVGASPNKPITVDGLPFDLGKDGLLYDPTGRPHIVQNGEIIPLAQLEHFVLSRRVSQAGQAAGTDLLKQHTEATRQFYDKVSSNPDEANGFKLRDDGRARKADEQYKLNPDPEVAEMLAKLTDVSALDPQKMFEINSARGTRASSVLSKYTQMDLEFWYVEKGLRDSKQPELVEQLRANRAKLFEMAKAEIEKAKDPSRISPENPEGFRYKYEKMMYDTSPLRFASFDEAIGELGDKRMTVWRGDYSFAKLIGMAPNNDVRQPDAKAVASDRAEKAQLTNLYDDLMKLEGSAVGRQYICTTSDLALLAGAFADSAKSQTVNLASVPAPIREKLLGWMDPQFPDGTTAEDKAKARKAALDRKDWIVPTEDGGKEIRDAFGIPGVILKLKVVDKKSGQVQVTAERKAFRIDIDKDAMLPGIVSLGGHHFESEQEIHGLEAVRPWKIKSTTEAGKLKEEFPVTTAAPAATPPPAAAPTDGGGVGFGEGGADIVGVGEGAAPAVTPPGIDGATPAATGATVTHETEWDAADGSGTNRSTVGVGEKVYFSADAEGSWSASVGTSTGSGQTFDWTAPGAGGSATITFTPSGGGTAVTKSLTVVAPSSVVMTKTSDDSFGAGTMGAGFRANVVFHPMNVSFAATEWKEDSGQAGEQPSGYFTDKTLPTHSANANWLGIGAGNSGPTDHAAFSGFPSPWTAGSFQWSIAQRWKLRSATTASLIQTLVQSCTLEGAPHAGRTTVAKGGASATRSPGGGGGGAGKGKGTGHGEQGGRGPVIGADLISGVVTPEDHRAGQIADMRPDQQSYYAAQRRQDPKGSEAEAVETALSSRELSYADREAVRDAQRLLASVTPRPINKHNNPNVVQIEITFDGTWNDRDEMAFKTNPALINDLAEGAKQYEKGVGTDTETKLVGGATGAGISNRIEHAYTELVANINKVKQTNPRAEVVLIITGFSRGSTAARAFANELNKRGVPDLTSEKRENGTFSKAFEAPRIGVMILFDTVGSVGVAGTNLNPGLDLSIPGNAENVLHLTAADEKRTFFPLSSAEDPKRPDDPRITEVALPGAHSDVGGSYPNRYSQIPLHMAHDYMQRAGVKVAPMESPMPDVNDPDLRLHDSGGTGPRTVYPSNNRSPYPTLIRGRMRNLRDRVLDRTRNGEAGGGGWGFGDGGVEVDGVGEGAAPAVTPPSVDGATPAATGATIEHEAEWDAADGSGTKRDNVGVGERVFLTADAEGSWTASTGTRRGTGQQFTWTAPGTAGSATITFTPTGAAAVTKTLTVVAPTSVRLTKKTDDSLPSGTVGAGFVADVTFHPLNVSFAATEWKEDTGQRATNASGVFAGGGRGRRRITLPTHRANPNWLGIGANNSGPTDHAQFAFTGGTFTEGGSFQWSIAQRWKLRSASGGSLIETLDQTCVVDGDPHAGRTTVSKGGASSVRNPDGSGGGGGGGEGEGYGHGYADGPPTSTSAVGEGLSTDGAEHDAESLGHEVGGRGQGGVDVDVDGVGDSSDVKPDAKPGAKPDELSLPDGVNMQLQSDGRVVARNEWLRSDPGYKQDAGGIVLPTRSIEILRALKASGMIYWMEDARIPELAKRVRLTKPLDPKSKFTRIQPMFAEICSLVGPPPGTSVMVVPDGTGLIAIMRTTDAVTKQVTEPIEVELTPQIRQKLWTAIESYTGIPFKPEVKTDLVNGPESWKPRVEPGEGGIYMPISEKTLAFRYGKKVWDDYQKKAKQDAAAGTGGVVTAGGVKFAETVPEDDRRYFLEWVKQISSGAGGSPDDTTITPWIIAAMRKIDAHPQKDKILEKLRAKGGGGKPQPLDTQYLENVINAVETEKARTDLGLKDTGSSSYKPLFDEPVRGSIMNRGGLLHVGEESDFVFEVENGRDAFAVPHLYVKWFIVKKDNPTTRLKAGSTHHIDISGKKPDYFEFEWKETGVFTVHAFVTHTFYQPAHYQIDVEVKTEAQRTKELNDGAFAGLKGDTTYETDPAGWPFDVSWFNTLFGSKKEEYGKKSWGTTPADFKRLSDEDRVKFLATDKQRLEDMIKAHTKDGTLTGEATDARWKDMVAYAKDKLKELSETQGTLDKEKKDGNTFFEARGTFLSRKSGIPDKPLKLVASAKKEASSLKTVVHDFTQLYEPLNYTFSASGTTFEKSIEATFVDLAKSYPPGRISCLFEALDDNAQPNKKTVGFEFDTGTAWKDVKSVVYNEHVMLAVNIIGAATMVFLPVTAPILFPLLGAYNSIETIDNMAQLQAKGALTWTNVATGVAQIGLNFLPYVGEMKSVAQFGKVAVYTLEGVTIAGMGAIMTIEAVEQIKRLRNQDISEVAELDGKVRELERTNPSDPQLPGLRAQLDAKIKNAQAESERVIAQMAKSGAIMLMQMGAIKGLQKHMAAKSVGALKKEGIFHHVDGVEPHFDHKSGVIKGDEKLMAKLEPAKLEQLKQSYALDMAAKQTELANILGTDKVEVVRGGDKVSVTKEGEGYKVQIPENKPFKDVLDEAWKTRKAVDPKAPADRPPPVVAEIKATLNPTEVVSGQNVAIGTRVQTEGEAHNILGKLAKGDRSAFKALGMEAPPREFDLRSVEWGIGQMPDGSFIIIRGESGAVNWAGFGGVRPVAHSHPLNAAKMLKGGEVTFQKLVEGGGANEVNKVNVFPSAADVSFCVRNGLGEHTVQTPYVSKGGGKIGNPTPGANEPLVQIKIVQPERVGSWAGNSDIGVYKSKMVATDASGKVLWTGDVHTIDHPSIGSLVMFAEPPSSLMSKPIAGRPPSSGTSTPSGGGGKPIPAADHLKLHQAAGDHARVATEKMDIPPEAQDRVKQAAADASEKGYLDQEAKTPGDTKATFKEGSKQAQGAAKKAANTEMELATAAKVEEKISSGDVFDTMKVKGDAAKAVTEYAAGTRGADGKRLSPQLEGKKVSEMEALLDAEVAAGRATKDTSQQVHDPTVPGGKGKQNQLVYEFKDGTLIRIKPKGDSYNPGDVMFSVEVKNAPPSDVLPGQESIAFKVDSKGRPVPKVSTDVKNPYDPTKFPKQHKLFQDTVMNAGHRKGVK